MSNIQCDFCGRILPDQDLFEQRAPNQNYFCSYGCLQAHELATMFQTAPVYPQFDEQETIPPDAFDMAQMCAA